MDSDVLDGLRGLSVAQAARRLGVHFATVRRMLKRGKLRPLVVGGRVRVDAESIDEMIVSDTDAWKSKNASGTTRRTPLRRRRDSNKAAADLGIVIEHSE